ncbi:MAG: Crp/Fnr family transcriptional regulator [Myxococcales bacterium]|nr:MAG: Crp/Fnr family transcriptional regulator [Myxococcales bacterium]
MTTLSHGKETCAMPLAAPRLKRFALFGDLPPVLLDAVAQVCQRRVYAKGESVAAQGDPAAHFFLVEYGLVKVYRASPDGREQTLHLVEGGQSFAEAAALSLADFPASAVALSDAAVILVPKKPFEALLAAHADLARAMIASQAKWLRRLLDLTSGMSFGDVASRLARWLVVAAERDGAAFTDDAVIELKQKKTVIAGQLHTTPESLSRALARFEADGLLRREGKAVRVLDAARLSALAEPSSP